MRSLAVISSALFPNLPALLNRSKTKIRPLPPAGDLRALDVLRGLLAVYVVIGHARWLLWAGHQNWVLWPHEPWEDALAYLSLIFKFGHEAVIVFFILSGFFIHYRAAEQFSLAQKPQNDAGIFFKRRAHRLLPPYMFALAVTVVLDVIGRSIYPDLYAGRTGDAIVDENFAMKGYTATSVSTALLGIPSATGQHFGTNGPLWSLAYEIIFYCLYPAWLALRLRSPRLSYAVPVVIAGVVLAVDLPFMTAVMSHYPLWIAGAALAELLHRHKLRFRLSFVFSAVLFPIAVAVNSEVLRLALYGIAGLGVVMAFLTVPSSAFRFESVKFVEKLGIASYSIYIFHFPCVALLSAITFAVFGKRPLSGWAAAGGALAAIAFTYLCFWLCERHFLHRGTPAAKHAVKPKLVPGLSST